jgi:threonine dehydrogenase-like Zn-dependent dehydrogenase
MAAPASARTSPLAASWAGIRTLRLADGPDEVHNRAIAEAMLVHEHACVAINPEMPLDRAAVIGCAVTTGAGTIFNACKLVPGETVAVIGCGGVGLATINAARIAGAGRIIAADPIPEKRELARRLGATDVVDAGAEGAAAEIVEMTKGGVDHAIEAVGRPASAALAVQSLRRGGTATILGMMPLGETVGLGAMDLLSGKRLQGASSTSPARSRSSPARRAASAAIAEAMADQGAKVVISSRKAEACEEVADAINASTPDRDRRRRLHLLERRRCSNLVDETRRQLGRIDILVCNAASNPYYGPMAGSATTSSARSSTTTSSPITG